MKKLVIIMMALLTCVGNAMADKISVDSVAVAKGDSVMLNFKLQNTEHDYSGIQFDIILAEGLSFALNSKGKISIQRGSRLNGEDDFALSVVKQGNTNVYKVLGYYSEPYPIPEKDGVLFSLILKADEKMNIGNISCTISDIVMSTTNAQKFTPSDTTFNIMVTKLIVTAKNCTREYGEQNPEFGFDVEGGILNGMPSITCNATSNSPVGVYPIVISKGNVSNSCVEYVNGTLTIEKAYQALLWEQDFSNIKNGEQVELTATASSGLEVTYTMDDSDVFSLEQVEDMWYLHCYGEGETVINAVQKGNENYWTTTKVSKTIVVTSKPVFMKGDVNHDGSITMADANMVVNYFLDTKKPEDFDIETADVNNDGSITMADANMIVNMFLEGEK